MEKSKTIEYTIKNHVAWITLNRPEKKNAINRTMRKEIQEAYTDVKFNDEVWATVITANGDVFCSGKDLLEKLPEDDGEVMSNDELYLFLRHIYKPVICAINGPCLAQGGGFALNSDIVIMSENSSIGWPQVKRGISSVSGPVLLAQSIPWTQAMSYLMRAKFIPAKECFRFGIANEIVPLEELSDTAERWAKEILSNAPAAVCAVKEAARRGEHLPFVDRMFLARDIANKVLHTEDSKEGILAFKEKREPKWKGK
tara:strand:- start:65521 stop:66288 length:768 start_codon:yes stop_codon:yes gene_type:complete